MVYSAGTTDAGDHTHGLTGKIGLVTGGSNGDSATGFNSSTDGSGNTGAASATDNKPAYFELIPVMRIA
jgi:hypothetical protein